MSPTEPTIAWSTLTKFISQLSHDLRNHLNAIELQSAFLSEIADNPDTSKEVQRLREMTAELSAHLQKLSRLLAKVQPMTMSYRASEFVEDLRAQLEQQYPAEATTVEWQSSLNAETFEIDPQLLQAACLELFENAFTHDRGEGSIIFSAQSGAETIEFGLSEPKQRFEGPVENWGAEPLRSIRHGHYGLGLFRARGILDAHHGTLRAQFDPAAKVFTTTISLPRIVS